MDIVCLIIIAEIAKTLFYRDYKKNTFFLKHMNVE